VEPGTLEEEVRTLELLLLEELLKLLELELEELLIEEDEGFKVTAELLDLLLELLLLELDVVVDTPN
jgi:hypothetical protein